MNRITKNLDIIIDQLNKGGIVIIPTDTIFGIACNAFNKKSIKKIFEIKKRPLSLPLSIAIKNKDYFNIVAKDISNNAQNVIDKYFPGQVTIILKKKDIISDLITANQDYVGIRIPDDKNLQYILNNIDFPIVLTSANIHNYPNCGSVEEINKQIGDKVDYILDGKINENKLGSTIVKFEDNDMTILRKGAIDVVL